VFAHKRHDSLTTGKDPLMLGFIREMLPEIEEAYRLEQYQASGGVIKSQAPGPDTSAAGTDAAEIFVSEEEAMQLESDYKRMKDECIRDIAEDFLRKHLIVFRHDEKDIYIYIWTRQVYRDSITKKINENIF